MESYPILEYEVYDGDTVNCVVQLKATMQVADPVLGTMISGAVTLSFPYPVSIRVFGVDTPELNREEQREAGLVAKTIAESWLTKHVSKGLACVFMERDKYSRRIVADIRIVGHESKGGLAAYLLRRKVAKPYDGGTKAEWTKAELKAIAEGICE